MSRSVPAKRIYMFANGVAVALERVGPLVALPIMEANPPPPPPLAPGVGGQMEPNPADPDYDKQLRAHQQKLNFLIQEAMFDLALDEAMPIDAEAVAKVRRVMLRAGVTLSEDDRGVYIKYVLVTNQADIEGLHDAIRHYDVTEEAISAAGDMFSDHGDGAAPVGGAPAVTEIEVAVSRDGAR